MSVVKYVKDAIQGKSADTKGTLHKRSSKWPAVRKKFLKDDSTCFVCKSRSNLEVHHKIPFHVNPTLELEPSNLITLCENKSFGVNCHLLFGHHGNYRKYNINVASDGLVWRNKLFETSDQ